MGKRDEGLSMAALRAALAAMRRCFLDFAGGGGQSVWRSGVRERREKGGLERLCR